ncbi:E3 ubiquitin-protein ligase RNF135 [Colossoma macropomum]|uniref:E3 ubiquitin-protein ligase RNF135 n=1 Tax=Colossoma macropomum TaxID=42526 RepID=UPI001863BE80|nr:E3 ubiquitin-protein ligase RNF135 [Colossoma macropomum]
MSAAHEEILKVVVNSLKCSICFELFVEPVTLACGHNYCYKCIESHLVRGKRNCPQCRFSLPAQHKLRKNVALSNILDLQEAGGREIWNEVVARTDHCFSYQREKLTREALVRRLESLKLEIKEIEIFLTELNCQDESIIMEEDTQTAELFSSSLDSGLGAAGSSLSSLPSEPEDSLNSLSHMEESEAVLPDPVSDAGEISEVLLEDRDALAGLTGACGLSDSAAVRLKFSEPAEFVLLSFSPTLGHRRLAFVPERRRMQVRSSCSPMTQNSRFDACQWMADQEFSAGRHYWDVDVSLCSSWAAGVAYPDLGRNQKLGRSSSSWCIERSSARLSAWHNNAETPLKQGCPESIRVLLDMV